MGEGTCALGAGSRWRFVTDPSAIQVSQIRAGPQSAWTRTTNVSVPVLHCRWTLHFLIYATPNGYCTARFAGLVSRIAGGRGVSAPSPITDTE